MEAAAGEGERGMKQMLSQEEVWSCPPPQHTHKRTRAYTHTFSSSTIWRLKKDHRTARRQAERKKTRNRGDRRRRDLTKKSPEGMAGGVSRVFVFFLA